MLEMRDAGFILFGVVSWLNTFIYSIWGISWVVLNIIASSFFWKDIFAIVLAKVLSVLGWGLMGVVWGAE